MRYVSIPYVWIQRASSLTRVRRRVSQLIPTLDGFTLRQMTDPISSGGLKCRPLVLTGTECLCCPRGLPRTRTLDYRRVDPPHPWVNTQDARDSDQSNLRDDPLDPLSVTDLGGRVVRVGNRRGRFLIVRRRIRRFANEV